MRKLLLCVFLAMATGTESGELRLVEEAGSTVKAFCGERTVFVYNYASDLHKPFIHPLYTPAGHEVTLNGPSDHVHHRGLMLAFGNIMFREGEAQPHINFWAERGAPAGLGRVIHKGFDEVKMDKGRCWLAARNEWRPMSRDDVLLLTERRKLTLFAPESERAYVLTWTSELTARQRDVVIGGTPGRKVSYYGLGWRVTRDMDGGKILDANGRTGPAAVNGDRARWCAYVGQKEPVRGFAMFDHPDNPRHPTGWFAMNKGFGYITASLVSHEPYQLKTGQTLRLCYGILVFDGEPTADFIDKQYQRWLERQRGDK